MSLTVKNVLLLAFPPKGKGFANISAPVAGGYRCTRTCLGNVCSGTVKRWEGRIFPSFSYSDFTVMNPIMAPDGMYAEVHCANTERGETLFKALEEKRVKFELQHSAAMVSKNEITEMTLSSFIADITPVATEV